MSITISCDERDIEDFLCTDNNLEEYLDLKYVDNQVKIDRFFIDILAYSKYEKCFYIIELKKDELNARAFAQALKYIRLMNIRYKNKHKFKMLLIGHDLNDELFYNVELYNAEYRTKNYPYLYTLFHYNFQDGISFSYMNKAQYNIQINLATEGKING